MPAQVYPQHRVPFLGRHREDHPVAQHPGVVDQDVQPPVRLQRRRDQPLARLPLPDVPRHHARPDLAGHRVKTGPRQVVQHQPRPGPRQRPRQRPRLGPAEPVGRAGHDGYPAVQAQRRVHAGHRSAPRPGQQAAVGHELAARRVGRLVAGQVGHQPGDLDRLGEPGQRHGPQERLTPAGITGARRVDDHPGQHAPGCTELTRIPNLASLELSPGPGYPDRPALAEELPNRATSVYHAVGTCRMGPGERAVVDPALRVRGIDGLRVADASIMPAITGGNTNAPAMMIDEHAARLMTAGS